MANTQREETESDADSEWRFGLDDVDEDGIVASESPPVEPQSIDTENALFVLLGVVFTLGLVAVTVQVFL